MKPISKTIWKRRDCRAMESRLWDYERGRLAPDDAAQVAAHLDVCASCRAQAEAYGATTRLLEAYRAESVPASEATWQELRARIESERPPCAEPVPTPARRGTTRLALAWSTTAMTGLLALSFLRPGTPPPFAPPEGTDSPLIESPLAGTAPERAANLPDGPELRARTGLAVLATVAAWEPSGETRLQARPTVAAFSTRERESCAFAAVSPRLRRRGHWHWRRVKDGGENEPLPANREPLFAPNLPLPTLAAAFDRAGLDGAQDDNAPPRNFVMTPISATTPEEPTRRYVMGTINLEAQNDTAFKNAQEKQVW